MVSLPSIKSTALNRLARLQVLWVSWNLRGFVLGSLILQTLLIFLAPFRKQTSNGMVMFSVWIAYLVAEYVANQAVGLIPQYSSETTRELLIGNTTVDEPPPHPDLLAFWSPFLLLHLGGPDTITALALEDNELWVRSLLQLGAQVAATGRVFFQSLEINRLWAATAFMFLAGIIKYVERTLSFFHARLTKFKTSMLSDPDPGPNYAKLMETYASSKALGLPTRFETIPEPDQSKIVPDIVVDDTKEVKLTEVELVRDAYMYFEKYKGLYVDLIFSFVDRLESRAYFLKRTEEQAFKVIEIELNFTYEVFYTKMVVIHKTVGKYLRPISVGCQVLSLVIWYFTSKKDFRPYDVRLTYTLLIGAISVDAISFVRLMFSDWQIAHSKKGSKSRAKLFDFLLSFGERTWGPLKRKEDAACGPWFRRIFFRRWSESISQFNLIDFCVDVWGEKMESFLSFIAVKDILDGVFYVSKKWFSNDLREFIFKELKYKSEMAADPAEAEEVCSSRGDWVLRSMGSTDFDPFSFYPWTADVEYDESLLIWHIATEICYQLENETHELKVKFYEKVCNWVWNTICNLVKKLWACLTLRKDIAASRRSEKPEDKYREVSKTLSDYMMYLLIMQPNMMSAVSGISEVRYRDTCAEAHKFFKRTTGSSTKSLTKESRQNEACKRMFWVKTDISPKEIKGDRSKSVMFNALCLARKLNELNEKTNNKWEVTAKVWVELLCYAAMHIRSNAHAAQLKRGGELLTIVWLLMVHLGLGKQFRITQGHARSKLIINK